METGRLMIDCVAAQYVVSAEHPSPRQVKDRLDTIIARELPRTLARAFESWFSDSDQSIWIIRQLNIETAIDVAKEPEHITRALATQIAKNLGATLRDGNEDNVRHYLNRAVYLASFLSDLGFGTAWSQWYYQSFAGLKALPLSSALRTAICDDIDTGTEALGLLATAELQEVVHGLTAQDARQVLERLAPESPARDKFRREAVLRAETKNDAALGRLGNEWQRALYVFIAATQEEKGLGSSSLGETPDAQVLVHPRSTALGGFFLILPHLDELPLAEATRNWPQADEAAAISLVRFLVLVKCCGRDNSERAFYDPLLRDLLLIPPTLTPAMLRNWQARLKREHLQNFLATLIDWQSSHDPIGKKEQLLIISQFRGRSLLLLIDAARGLWLLVDRYSLHRVKKIMAALLPYLAMLMKREGVLYSDPSVIELLRLNFVELNVINLSDHPIDLAGVEERGIHTILARLDKLPDELEFLTLPSSFKIARPLDLTLSIVAQHLLRGVAYRLPGFAGSNLAYLSRNFFDFAASIEEEPACRVVRVGQPPLHLVLNMIGMNRQSYRLSWLDDRPFALFQSE